MSFEADFQTLLAGDATLSGLMGGRIRIQRLAQGEAEPNLVWQRIGGAPGYQMRGPEALEEVLLQMDIRAASFAEAKPVRDALKNLLSGYAGTVGSTVFAGIFITDERDGFKKPGSREYHMISLDCAVWHQPV